MLVARGGRVYVVAIEVAACGRISLCTLFGRCGGSAGRTPVRVDQDPGTARYLFGNFAFVVRTPTGGFAAAAAADEDISAALSIVLFIKNDTPNALGIEYLRYRKLL